jgi:hypothetical protein
MAAALVSVAASSTTPASSTTAEEQMAVATFTEVAKDAVGNIEHFVNAHQEVMSSIPGNSPGVLFSEALTDFINKTPSQNGTCHKQTTVQLRNKLKNEVFNNVRDEITNNTNMFNREQLLQLCAKTDGAADEEIIKTHTALIYEIIKNSQEFLIRQEKKRKTDFEKRESERTEANARQQQGFAEEVVQLKSIERTELTEEEKQQLEEKLETSRERLRQRRELEKTAQALDAMEQRLQEKYAQLGQLAEDDVGGQINTLEMSIAQLTAERSKFLLELAKKQYCDNMQNTFIEIITQSRIEDRLARARHGDLQQSIARMTDAFIQSARGEEYGYGIRVLPVDVAKGKSANKNIDWPEQDKVTFWRVVDAPE